jgi:hypothetical protein
VTDITGEPVGAADNLEQSAEEAIRARSTMGWNFSQAINRLREPGAKAQIGPTLRRGLMVEEMLQLSEGLDNDLLALGSHHQAVMIRGRCALPDDVPGERLDQAPVSTLIIHPPRPPANAQD